MQRVPNWQAHLDGLLVCADQSSFCWGVNDCALFAADGVRVQTGLDLAAPFRGRYTTAIGAARALKRYGSGDLFTTIDDFLGRVGAGRTTLSFAHRGDVVVMPGCDGLAAGLVDLSGRMIVTTSPDGLIRLPIADAVVAWGIE